MLRSWSVARVVLVPIAALAVLVVTSAAMGAEPDPTLTIAPTSGVAGTTVHVTGTGCPQSTWDTSLHWRVHVQTQSLGSTPSAGSITQPSGTPTTPIVFPAIGYPGLAIADVVPATDGTWSADITIPADGTFAAIPGSYPVSALCFASEGSEAGTITYAAPIFVVTPTPTPLLENPTFTG